MVVPLPTDLCKKILVPADPDDPDDLAMYISCYSLVTMAQIP